MMSENKSKFRDKIKEISKTEQKKRRVDKRSTSLKRFSITATILFVALILVFNLVFDSVLGSVLKWDWSPTGMYSIGDVTRDILADLDKDVEIIGLFDVETNTTYTRILPMLDEYAARSGGRLTVRYVNPDRHPSILQYVDPEGYLQPAANTFVVYSPDTGKAKNVTNSDVFQYEIDYQTYSRYMTGISAEQSFTGAIRYVSSETTPVVYFTTGHDEIDYKVSYTTLEQILTNNNYDVDKLDLFGLESIPEDCSVLIMASPKRDITAASRQIMYDYLRNGGSLMVITDYHNGEFPQLNTLLEEFNLEISNNKVREGDRDHRYQDDPYNIRAIAPRSKVTETAIDGFTLVNNVRGINELFNVKEWIEIEPVLITTDQGFAETKGDPEQSSAAGVQNIALLAEHKGWLSNHVDQTAKVMVIGSSSIFSDQILQTFGTNLYNPGLFFYSIQWLANDDAGENLYIRPKALPTYVVTRGSTTTNVFTTALVMILLPCALLLAALIVYRRRKHL